MSSTEQQHPTDLDKYTQTLAAFAEFQRARHENDYTAAARAERNLERLGYVVRVVRPIRHQEQSAGGKKHEVPNGRR